MKSIRDFGNGDVNQINTDGVPTADKYAGLSQSELTAELMRTVAAAKSDGSFSPERLREFVAFVSPNLDDSSRARLNELVNSIINA